MRAHVRAYGTVVALGLGAAACQHRVAPVAPTRGTPFAAKPATPPAPAPLRRASVAAPAAPSAEELFRRKSLDELNAEHPLADAFFDYNQNELREDARNALQRDAAWLEKWPQTHVSIEGHCDERGTAEYNLALGDRRAQAARDYLVSLGVSSNRISMKSLGKEAPFCTGDGESCWSQNRRGHFLITGK
jgi:peptidoglycan-associated lipoprotein